LAEERQVLEFYDQQLAEGFGKLEAAKQEFDKAQLEHFAQIRIVLQSEQATLADIKTQATSLKQERDAIETDVVKLRDERSEIEAKKEDLRTERESFAREKEAHDRVAKLLHPDISSKGYARISGENLEVFASSIPVGISRRLSLMGAPDWVRVFYSERQKAMDATWRWQLPRSS